MNKTLLSYISDGIAVAVICFTLSFALSNYFIGRGVQNFIIAVSLTVAVSSAYILVSKTRRKRFSVKRADEKSYESLVNSLRLMSETEADKFILSLGLGSAGHKKVCKFSFKAVDKDDLLFALKTTPSAKIDFFGVDFDVDAIAFSETIKDKIEVFSGKQIFDAAKNSGKLPKENRACDLKSQKVKTLIKASFQKGRAGKIALYGAAMLILSRFVFYPIWYIVCGSAFLIYALAIKFFAKD